jgi:hypothetical protein
MKGTLRLGVLIAAVMLLVTASAHAEEGVPPTRDEYVAHVDPICEANTLANKRILKNVREKARNDKTMKEAGAQFTRASAAFGKTIDKISTVPRPPADDARLLKWFDQLRIVQSKLGDLGKALKEEDEIKAAHQQIKVERASNAANNVGFIFDFRYCRITPGRFL